MKKKIALLTAVAAAVFLLASSIGYTMSYYKDSETAAGSSVSAGNLNVTLDLLLANYGVPGNTLMNYFGNATEPAYSGVTVTNDGSIDMKYTLILTVDDDTLKLIDVDGLELIDADGDTVALEGGADRSTYRYIGKTALKSGESHEFSLSFTFRGEDLVDGNAYQNRLISIKATVEAVQLTTGGGGE